MINTCTNDNEFIPRPPVEHKMPQLTEEQMRMIEEKQRAARERKRKSEMAADMPEQQSPD